MFGQLVYWFILLELLSLAAFPFVYRALARLPDRGYALSKPAGLLLVSFVAWVIGLSHLIPNSRWSVSLAVLAVAALSWLVIGRREELVLFFRANARTVVATEAVFLAVFLIVGLIRAATPDIVHTEQPMDFMFLNAVVNSSSFPPHDPWLAGEQVSYYYFVYLMIGTLTLLSGLSTAVAYNLGLATVAAMGAVAAFGLVLGLVRLSGGTQRASIAAGLGGVFLLVFASSLAGTLELARAAGAGTASFWGGAGVDGLALPAAASSTWTPDEEGWWWWRASRVIPGTINEFPFFSFLLGDLHPHVMSIGFVLLAVGVSVQFYLTPDLLTWRSARGNWPLMLLAVVSVGALAATNLWDLPLVAALVAGALLLNAARHGLRLPRRLGRAVVAIAALLAVSLLAFFPFYLTLEVTGDGVLPLRGLMTRPVHLLLIWGVLGGIALSLFVTVLPKAFTVGGNLTGRLGVAAYVGFAPVMLWFQPVWGALFYVTVLAMAAVIAIFVMRRAGYKLLAADEVNFAGTGTGLTFMAGSGLLFGLLLWDGVTNGERGVDGQFSSIDRLIVTIPIAMVVTLAIYGAWSLAHRDATAQPERWHGMVPVMGLLAVAATLIMGAELFHVVDFFGGDLRRMNTVFKLYYQAWLLLSIVAGFALWYVTSRWNRRAFVGRVGLAAWVAVLALAIGAVSYYPLAGIAERTTNGSALTLDGQRHLSRSAPAELAAIEWVRDNLPRGAVVVEAAEVPCGDASGGCSDWTDTGRIAGSTGRPTIVGWEQHEFQWRASRAEVSGRRADVRTIYDTQDIDLAAALLESYGADYLVVGPRERRAYSAEGLAKLPQLGSLVYTSDGVGEFVIYRLLLDARAS